jgi:hypothetical protein
MAQEISSDFEYPSGSTGIIASGSTVVVEQQSKRPRPPPVSPLKAGLQAVKGALTTAVKAARKATSSVSISIAELFELSTNELATILAKGEAAKGAFAKLHFVSCAAHVLTHFSLPAGKEKQLVTTAGGCVVTQRTIAYKPKPGKESKAIGEQFKYAEFNSNAIPRLGSRRYRLYQVAAAYNMKVLYPAKTVAQWQEWLQTTDRPEASHICRTLKTITYTLPSGQQQTVTLTEEVKGCFCRSHLVIEPAAVNRSRIKCDGGSGCQHNPPCIVVEA